MSGWKANLLSIGGHLTLIKSGGHEDTKKITLVKWLNILASLDKGGLGVGSLKAFNKALLLKWRWRLFQNPNALWVHVVKAIHGDEAGVDFRGCQTNGVWASIVGTINHLHSSGIVPLNSIRFKDWDWSRPITIGRMKTEFDNLILDIASLESDEIVGFDSCIWNLSNDDTFSVIKVRKHIEECSLPMLSPSTPLGWLLEEIHVTWARLEKKRTRLGLYTNYLEENHTVRGDGVANYKRRRQNIQGTTSRISRRRQNEANLKKP
ncbi:hypothetical protein Tco_1294797 [Tanacetum coccineum]